MLIAVDGSEQGIVVLTEACSLARSVGISLRILTVEPAAADQPSASLAASKGRLERRIRAVLSQEGMSATVPTVEVRRGPIVQQILATADASDTDVLAIGYHRGGLPGVLEAGSTARRLAHTAPCAVLTIPL
jgi:nucleotide-binding universal stress UspA family protein